MRAREEQAETPLPADSSLAAHLYKRPARSILRYYGEAIQGMISGGPFYGR
jgi:hypothetical protein